MTDSPQFDPKFLALVDAACDGRLTAEDKKRLEGWLESPEHAAAYVENMRVHAQLAWQIAPIAPFTIDELRRHVFVEAAMAGRDLSHGRRWSSGLAANVTGSEEWRSLIRRAAETSLTAIDPGRHPVQFGMVTLAITLAFVAFILSLITLNAQGRFQDFAGHGHGGFSGAGGNGIGAPSIIARVSGTSVCRWAEGQRPLLNKSGLLAGEEIHLQSGLLQITFGSGASVILEGPAMLVVDARGAGSLQHGKLVATVPRQAIGFTITTPSARIVDLGTKFGVAVDGNRETKVFVLKGSVAVSSPAPSPEFAAFNLFAGESARVGNLAGMISLGDVDPAQFTTSMLAPPQIDSADKLSEQSETLPEDAGALKTICVDFAMDGISDVSGAAVVAKAGDQWNNIRTSIWTNVNSLGRLSLKRVDGSPSGVNLEISAGTFNGTPAAGGLPVFEGNIFLESFEGQGASLPATIRLTGFAANTRVDLYLYSASGDTTGQGGTFNFGSNSKTTDTADIETGYRLGVNYVRYKLAADSAGTITGTWSAKNRYAVLNGLQIEFPPASPQAN